ncbi:glycosyltransferase [Hansschlegelia sp. KR7-227]|uniref:glycosyltransferase n=1 Tax=Hansschlegelia sp. KR7-227 TaxID=3400914 RepID=UPI003BFF9FDF
MLSVIIPTRNDERTLVPTLASLVPGVADGVVRDVVIADGGSTDGTLEVADVAGCNVLGGGACRGARLDAAARRSKGPWLLFLEPGVTLGEGWRQEVRSLIDTLERSGREHRCAAVFRFGLDDFGAGARAAERLAALRDALTGLPQPEQGLLIHKRFYESVGGYRALPAMAEADLIRRIGRRRILRLRARALASANRAPRREGERTGLRAALGEGLLMLRVPPSLVARLHD